MNKEDKVLLDEFMGKRYTPYNDNHSINLFFDSYSKCEMWIKNNNKEGFIPQLNFRKELGEYDKHWGELMEVFIKINTLVIDRRPVIFTFGSEGVYIALNRSNSFETSFPPCVIVNTLNINYFANDPSEETSLIESVGIAAVEFVKWYNKRNLELSQKIAQAIV